MNNGHKDLLSARHYLSVLQELDELFKSDGSIDSRKRYLLEMPQITTARKFVSLRTKESREAAELCWSFPMAGTYILNAWLESSLRMDWLTDALEAALYWNDLAAEGWSRGNLANALIDLGEYEEALVHLKRRLEIARLRGRTQAICTANTNIGNAHLRMGNATAAIDHYEEALNFANKISSARDKSRILGNLGVAYRRLGRYQDALKSFQDRLVLAKQVNDQPLITSVLNNLGHLFVDMEDKEAARSHFIEALEKSRRTSRPASQASALGGLAQLAEEESSLEAKEFLLDALELYRQNGSRSGEAEVLGELGRLSTNMGELVDAEEQLQSAIAINREIGSRHEEGSDLGNLGRCYEKMGRIDCAKKLYQERIQLAHEIEDAIGKAWGQWKLGLLLIREKKFDDGRDLLRHAQSTFNKLGRPEAESVQVQLDGLKLIDD